MMKRRDIHSWLTAVSIILGMLAFMTAGANAATAVGDAGHYIMGKPKVYFHNPDGRAFTVTLHRFEWWIGGGWNRAETPVKVTAPDGNIVFDKVCEVKPKGYVVAVPAGAPGPYRLELDSGSFLNYYWLESDLDRAVVWTGEAVADMLTSQAVFYNPFVPRTWTFWVPPETERFTVWTQNNRGRSQREDHGLTVISPRGQRMAVLWGQANPDAPLPAEAKLRTQQAEVLVEPGSAGRFWSIEVRLGDSHTYSDVHFVLQGVPPYVARSPEEWFNPETGQPAVAATYDETQFVQSDVAAAAKPRLFQHWTPCPAIGDPDGCEIGSPARLALWNPENRPLHFVIGTYLPRNMFPEAGEKSGKGWAKLPVAEHDHAQVRIAGTDGGAPILDERIPLLHLHGGERSERILTTGSGVAVVDITGAEHFWTYTYPATPLVMLGQPAEEGWQRFRFEAGTARNWYFQVPRGTKSFKTRIKAQEPGDIVQVAVCAPDRIMGQIFGNSGETTVVVPEGLDGKLWHIRPEFAGATRFAEQNTPPRFPHPMIELDLMGVPGILSPTWEQWFDPENR